MSPFPYPAAIAVVDKMAIKVSINIIIDKMMHYSVTKTAGKDFPFDRVGDNEANALTYGICSME